MNILVWLIKRYEKPSKPVDIPWMPGRMRLFFSSISSFDPDFSRSWVYRRIYEGLNSENALLRVRCPVLIICADWFRTEKGLVGAMDDKDAKHAEELVPHAEYVRIRTRHVTHLRAPSKFVELITKFAYKE